jgi:hypothetical protein
MQLMTWPLARLGSRFGLLFEPHHRRVMHSALGRFMDRPLDLAVGLIAADGTERVLPFTRHGEPFYACEQSERNNSVTFRGYDEKLGLKFELNLHSVFYPQDERLCILPVFYVELRVTWARRIRWLRQGAAALSSVRLFVRVQRPETDIRAIDGRIDLSYDVPLAARYVRSGDNATDVRHDVLQPGGAASSAPAAGTAHVEERIQSLNDGARAYSDDRGHGLALDLPVTEEGSGTKWRLVWAAHTADSVLSVRGRSARLRYNQYWRDLDAVMTAAIDDRDENLAHSRRFEKLLEQAPHIMARRHLTALGFQSFLSNTFWCDIEDGSEWFSNWEGTCLYHSTVDVEYNLSQLYFALWPQLLVKTIDQWVHYGKEHADSGGLILSHDMGVGMTADRQAYPHEMPVEENANFLLLMQAYCHWCGERQPAREHARTIADVAHYLIWSDRDASGLPSAGTANTIDDAGPAVQYSRKQTYLAVKRIAALRAACDLLRLGFDDGGQPPEDLDQLARQCEALAERDASLLEDAAWLGDHYAVCVDRSAVGVIDPWTGDPLPYDELPGWDAYSIYNGSALQPPVLERERLRLDVAAAMREAAGRYGCGHSSGDVENVWVSQNLWRDHLAEYLGLKPMPAQHYWDMQVFSNTAGESRGFVDTYVTNNLTFYPRGVAAIGYFLAGPRLIIDRLAGGGVLISITPNRDTTQRWPLLPLADWQAGKVPVCVVQSDGDVHIEGETDPVIIRGQSRNDEGNDDKESVQGGTLIG